VDLDNIPSHKDGSRKIPKIVALIRRRCHQHLLPDVNKGAYAVNEPLRSNVVPDRGKAVETISTGVCARGCTFFERRNPLKHLALWRLEPVSWVNQDEHTSFRVNSFNFI
jgi:hypothetical protein